VKSEQLASENAMLATAMLVNGRNLTISPRIVAEALDPSARVLR